MSDCEAESTFKDGSPGLVQDSETLSYVLFDDEYRNGEFTNQFVRKSRLKKSEVSVARMAYLEPNGLRTKVIEPRRAKNPDVSLVGVIFVCTKQIREQTLPDGIDRAICIFDFPLPGFCEHAHLGYSDAVARTVPLDQNVRVAVRENLVELLRQCGISSPD